MCLLCHWLLELHRYANASGVCLQCSDQCSLALDPVTGVGGCTGPGPNECASCSSVRLNGVCVQRCPDTHYVSPADNVTCLACDPQCVAATGGGRVCSGAGPTACTACSRFFRLVNGGPTRECVATCATDEYPVPGAECRRCDGQCRSGCTGPDSVHCTACALFRHSNGSCVSACPTNANVVSTMIAADRQLQSVCTVCSSACATTDGAGVPLSAGCTGPTSIECYRCAGVRRTDGSCASSCGPGYYNQSTPTSGGGELACSACNTLCNSSRSCTGPLARDCEQCLFARYAGSCVSQCPPLTFVGGPAGNRTCTPCNVECRLGCNGPADTNCARGPTNGVDGVCAHFALPLTGGGIRCVNQCPTMTFSNMSVCTNCNPRCAVGGAIGCRGSTEAECMCPVGRFWDPVTRRCSDCDGQCDASGETTPAHLQSCSSRMQWF